MDDLEKSKYSITSPTSSKMTKSDDSESQSSGVSIPLPLNQPQKDDKVEDVVDVDDDDGDDDDDNDEEPPHDANPEFLLLEDCDLEHGPDYVDRFLTRFVSFHESNISANTQAELLVLLVYCIALESGFTSIDSFDKCFSSSKQIGYSDSFHSRNIRKLSRYYPPMVVDCNNTVYTIQLRQICVDGYPLKAIQSRLACIVSGDYLLVTLAPDPSIAIPGGSICLSINRYVMRVTNINKPLYNNMRKLKELSFQLREKVFVPVRNYQLSVLEGWCLSYPSLLGMPFDLYAEIFKRLKAKNIKILGKTCRYLRMQCANEKFFIKS